MQETLLNNGFVVWKWGKNKKMTKIEGFLPASICNDLIGVDEDCFVAALLEINEARFIRKNKFDQKVQGHEKQLQIERIIFGEDKEKIMKDGRLILFETIIELDKLVNYLQNN